MWLFREKILFSVFHKWLFLFPVFSSHQLSRVRAVWRREREGVNASSRQAGIPLSFLGSLLK